MRANKLLVSAIVMLVGPAPAFAIQADDTADSETPPPTIDSNGDGTSDAWDRDGDGRADAWDTDGDGAPDALDEDGDGEPDEE